MSFPKITFFLSVELQLSVQRLFDFIATVVHLSLIPSILDVSVACSETLHNTFRKLYFDSVMSEPQQSHAKITGSRDG